MKAEAGTGLRSLRVAVVVFVLGAVGVGTRVEREEREPAGSAITENKDPPRCPRGTLEERGLCVPVRVPGPIGKAQ